MALGGEPVGERFIEWNFVSSSKERIEQAKADWRAGPHETPRLRQPGIHPARMITRVCFSLLALATLAACAYTPPTLTNRLDIRQVPYTPDSGTIAIRCGKLIDGDLGHSRMRDALVVIRDGRIKSIKAGASRNDAVATHVPVLDLSGYTCLPGLIDMHTHLTDRPEDTADLTVYFSRPAEETLRLSKENASATLLAGFTSVRNVGTYALGTDTALRDAINAGKAAGPRMQASGPYLTIPHGGGDLYIPDFKEPAGQRALPCRRRARARINSASAPIPDRQRLGPAQGHRLGRGARVRRRARRAGDDAGRNRRGGRHRARRRQEGGGACAWRRVDPHGHRRRRRHHRACVLSR